MNDMSREVITLDAEEQHELLFRIQVEGNDVSPARVRLVCESDEMSYMFNGRSSGEEGIVQFALPVMKDKISEGIHSARVEVLIDNKYFAPVQFDLEFKKPIKVFAEALKVLPPVTRKPELKVTGEAVTIRQVETVKPLVIETKIPEPPVSEVQTTVPKNEEQPVVKPQENVKPPIEIAKQSLPQPRPDLVVPGSLPAPIEQRPTPGSLRDRYQKRSTKGDKK